MGTRAQGGNGGRKTTVEYTPRRSREEKDRDIITCCSCGEKKVAKGSYYYIKTQKWDKKYQRYYRLEFYKTMCIPCSNAYDRKWSKDNAERHKQIVRKSWRRLHAKKPETRALVYPEAYK